MKYGYGEYALVFKALSDETRLKILVLLTADKLCACRILEAFNFTQPTLSYHMKLLTDSKLVNAEKNGKWIYYSINCKRIELLHEFIAEIEKIEKTTDNCCGIKKL